MKKIYVSIVSIPLLIVFSLVAESPETVIKSLPIKLQDTIQVHAHRTYRHLYAHYVAEKKQKKQKKPIASLSTKIKNWFKKVHATNILIWYLEVRKKSSPASAELTNRMRSILRAMGVKNTTRYHLKIYADVDRNGVVFPFEPTTVYISQGTLDTASQEIIDFTLAHECSHAVYETPFKVIPLLTLAYGVITYSWHQTKKLFPLLETDTTPQILLEETLKGLVLYNSFCKYMCYREKRADLNAAQALGSAYCGLIDLGATYLLFGTQANDSWHPLIQDRILYLYEWECKNCRHQHLK